MIELMVGSRVRLLRDMMKETTGALGYVYETYQRGDGTIGASIIFQNGSYDGFSPDEQVEFLSFEGDDPRYAGYEFLHVGKVESDYRNGYWNFKDVQEVTFDQFELICQLFLGADKMEVKESYELYKAYLTFDAVTILKAINKHEVNTYYRDEGRFN